jgi:hypothetical protein
MKHVYKPKAYLLIYGDINTDYLIESNRKIQPVSFLTTYNLSHTGILKQEFKITQALPLIIYVWITVD